MKEFKIRCSAIGQIMTNPRAKKDKEAGNLSQSAKSYCDMWIKEQLYSRKSEFTSKYTDKGIEVEQESIEFAAEQLNWGLVFKNDEYKENEFITGTPDLVRLDTITDMKNSWDWSTFPILETAPPDKNNEWQLLGYMDLFGVKKGEIVYTLIDTPEPLIEREMSKLMYKLGVEELTDEQANEVIRTHRYSDVADNLKIKVFPINYDAEKIEAIKLRVLECRNYIKNRLLTIKIK